MPDAGRNRALADLLIARVTGAPEIEELRSRAFAGTVRLIDRAKRSGQLRREFRHEDLILLLMANAGLVERTARTAPTAWERHLDYVLDGLRPSATHITRSPGGAAVPCGHDGSGAALRLRQPGGPSLNHRVELKGSNP